MSFNILVGTTDRNLFVAAAALVLRNRSRAESKAEMSVNPVQHCIQRKIGR